MLPLLALLQQRVEESVEEVADFTGRFLLTAVGLSLQNLIYTTRRPSFALDSDRIKEEVLGVADHLARSHLSALIAQFVKIEELRVTSEPLVARRCYFVEELVESCADCHAWRLQHARIRQRVEILGDNIALKPVCAAVRLNVEEFGAKRADFERRRLWLAPV